MSIVLGYDYYATVFQDDSTSLSSVKHMEYSGSIIDEISLRSKTNQGMNNVRDTWQNDQHILGKFVNTLEAGNVENSGVKIIKFKIVRRLVDQQQNNDIFLGDVPFDGNEENLSYTDSTQPNDNLIYTIIPVGENGLDGTPQEVSISSDFTGIWIVDKDTNEVLVFDKAIGQVGNIESTLNQNRTQIDTFSKYPQFYYGEQNYETFSLSTVILPKDGERTGKKYNEILSKFVLDHKPKIVKTDTGKLLIADISNVRTSTPVNTWKGYDYLQITVDVAEVEDYYKELKANPPVVTTTPSTPLDGGTFSNTTTGNYDGGGF